MRQSWETMTSVSAGHIIQTPTQPVGSGRPQRESNPGPPHQESRALPQSYRAPRLRQQSRWVFEILVAEIYIMLGGLNVIVRVRQISNSNYDLNLGLPIEANLFSRSSAI